MEDRYGIWIRWEIGKKKIEKYFREYLIFLWLIVVWLNILLFFKNLKMAMWKVKLQKLKFMLQELKAQANKLGCAISLIFHVRPSITSSLCFRLNSNLNIKTEKGNLKELQRSFWLKVLALGLSFDGVKISLIFAWPCH